MKILVISEAFDNGGLETQIKTYYEALPKNIKMIFAFGKYTEKIKLNNTKIYTGFHFSYVDTIKEFCEDVNKLVEIIKKEKIDVMHVHPYYSFFAAYFASQITNTKLIYTYHGLSSYNFLKTPISQIIFNYAFESNGIAKLFSVNIDGIKCFEDLGSKNCSYLPNPIDSNKFHKLNYKNTHKFALVSRIDKDKIEEIKKLIANLDKFKIRTLDIYGDGSEISTLEQFIHDNHLEKKINLKGYVPDIYNVIDDSYNGIIGIGRVVLESLTMKMPTIIIGYNKLTGYIDEKIYEEIKKRNFVNRFINYTNYKFPTSKDIEYIYNDILDNFEIKKIINKYLTEIKTATSQYMQNINDLYNGLVEISLNDNLKNCYFHKEKEVYKLVEKYIVKYSLRSETINIWVNANFSYEIQDLFLININEIKKGMIENEKN